MRWVDYLVRSELVESRYLYYQDKNNDQPHSTDVPMTKTQAGPTKRIQTKEVVRMARIVPMGIDF